MTIAASLPLEAPGAEHAIVARFPRTLNPGVTADRFPGGSWRGESTVAEQVRQVLVVDGEGESRERIRQSLASRAIEIVGVATGAEGLEALQGHDFQLAVFDLVLPDMTGLGFCRLLREDPQQASLRKMVVSAWASEIDRVLAFESGVDDFIAKPFYPSELGARVHAILRRRAAAGQRAERSAPQAVHFDVEGRSVRVRGQRVMLTATEFELLASLVRAAGRVMKRNELILRVWGPQGQPGERAVDSHIKAIRRKLGEDGSRLETVRGCGYRFACSDPA
jgi:DNA-binding response OmpR family regulator